MVFFQKTGDGCNTRTWSCTDGKSWCVKTLMGCFTITKAELQKIFPSKWAWEMGSEKRMDRRGQDEKQGFVQRLVFVNIFCSYVMLNKFLVSRNPSASSELHILWTAPKTNGRADLMRAPTLDRLIKCQSHTHNQTIKQKKIFYVVLVNPLIHIKLRIELLFLTSWFLKIMWWLDEWKSRLTEWHW